MTFRCSQASRDDAEPLIGTAPTESRYLFIEHTGPWGRAAVADSRLAGDVRAHLAAADGVRVQLIRRHGGATGRGVRVFAASRDRGSVRVESTLLADDAALLELDLAALAATGTAGLPAYDEPLWLVCTNGRRDLCCADLGRATVKALATRWPEATWETTHLGGHRFAATLLALPSLVTLGRLQPDEAVAACSEVAAGRVPLNHHRGRAGWPAIAQVADDHVRRELRLAPIEAIDLRAVAGDQVTLGVAGEQWQVVVAATAGEPRRQSCADDRLKATTRLRVASLTRLG